jgi:hypothetical protein
LDLVHGDLEHQIGPMGLGPDPGVGSEQGGEIELVDGLVDGAGEMVGGQGVLDLEPLGGETIPGRRGEAIEVGDGAGVEAERPSRRGRSRGEADPAADGSEVEAGVSWLRGSFRLRCRVDICNPKTREPSFAISPRTRRKRDDLSRGGDVGISVNLPVDDHGHGGEGDCDALGHF